MAIHMGKKGSKFPSGTWFEREMFESPAYMALRGCAPQVLTILLGKRHLIYVGNKGHKKWQCTNCDSLTFTYVEAEKKYGITKPRLARALDELFAKGFITCKYRGGGYKQDKSIYALSGKWLLWRPGNVFEKRKKDSVQRGFCKPKRQPQLVQAAVK